jgi:hypothetical protein
MGLLGEGESFSSSSTPSPSSISPQEKYEAFLRFLGFGIAGHVLQTARRISSAESIFTYNINYDWSPGLPLPLPYLNFFVNFVLFPCNALYIAWNPRSCSPFFRILLFFQCLLHFLALPLRVPNHFFVVLLTGVVILFTELLLLFANSNAKYNFPSSTSDSTSSHETDEESLHASLSLSSSPSSPSPSSFSSSFHTILRRVLPTNIPEIYSTGLACARVLLVGTYFFAFFHKLNDRYLDVKFTPIKWLLLPILKTVGSGPIKSPEITMFMAVSSLILEFFLAFIPWLPSHIKRLTLCAG